jgi:hypothetical protein
MTGEGNLSSRLTRVKRGGQLTSSSVGEARGREIRRLHELVDLALAPRRRQTREAVAIDEQAFVEQVDEEPLQALLRGGVAE